MLPYRTSLQNLRLPLGQNRPDAGQLTEVDQCRVQIGTIAEAGIFIRPALKHSLHVAMRGDEAMRPERNSTFSQPGIDLLFGWLKNRGTSDDHSKFSVYPAETGEHALSHFADQFH